MCRRERCLDAFGDAQTQGDRGIGPQSYTHGLVAATEAHFLDRLGLARPEPNPVNADRLIADDRCYARDQRREFTLDFGTEQRCMKT